MQRRVRDARAGYAQSLEVLREAKACGVYTKSSIMLGLGETDAEIIDTLLDLRDVGQCPLRAGSIIAGCRGDSSVCAAAMPVAALGSPVISLQSHV